MDTNIDLYRVLVSDRHNHIAALRADKRVHTELSSPFADAAALFRVVRSATMKVIGSRTQAVQQPVREQDVRSRATVTQELACC